MLLSGSPSRSPQRNTTPVVRWGRHLGFTSVALVALPRFVRKGGDAGGGGGEVERERKVRNATWRGSASVKGAGHSALSSRVASPELSELRFRLETTGIAQFYYVNSICIVRPAVRDMPPSSEKRDPRWTLSLYNHRFFPLGDNNVRQTNELYLNWFYLNEKYENERERERKSHYTVIELSAMKRSKRRTWF